MTNLTARDFTVSDKASVPDVEAFIDSFGIWYQVSNNKLIDDHRVRTLAAQYQKVIDERDAEIAALKSRQPAWAIDQAIYELKQVLDRLRMAGYAEDTTIIIHGTACLSQLQTLRDLIK